MTVVPRAPSFAFWVSESDERTVDRDERALCAIAEGLIRRASMVETWLTSRLVARSDMRRKLGEAIGHLGLDVGDPVFK